MTDSVNAPLKKTPLHGTHVGLGARMVPFGGWDMPVEYSGITAEHMAVRTAAGVTQLQVIPVVASSLPIVLVRPITPALVAL